MPSLPWDWRPSSFPSPHPWRLECDPRRDPAARREGLQQRSSPMAALNGERWGGDLENCGGLGGDREKVQWRGGGGFGEPVGHPLAHGGSPQPSALVSCFFLLPLFSLPPANFQTVGGKGLENKCVCCTQRLRICL